MITLFNSLRRVSCRSLTLGALLLSALSALTGACEKVPLLAPSGSSITLTSSATTLPINGSTTLTAQVLEPSGTPPHSGTRVSFTTTLGSFQPADVDTDISGRATVTFLAGNASGTATITAISGGAGGTTTTSSGTGGSTTTTGSSNSVRIAIGAAAVGGVTLVANPATVSALGGPALLTANVRDTNGNVLPGVPVTFSTDNGTFSATVVTTDQAGTAQTTLTTNKVSKVTAAVGIAGTGTSTTPAPTATVTINVNSAPAVKVDAPVPLTPSVGQSVTFGLTYTTDAASSAIVSVRADFGDGSAPTTYPGKVASVSHTYSAIGSYTVRVTATDALGDTASATGSVVVIALTSVTVGTPTPASPTVGQAVTFPLTYTTGTGTGATTPPIQRIRVNYGDGTVDSFNGTPSSVSHTYTTSGVFGMRVTAFDAFGNSSEGGISIVVGARLQPTVLITPPTTSPTAGTDITFTIRVTPAANTAIQSVTMDFGDGELRSLGPVTGESIAVHKVYQNPNTNNNAYTVVLTATDSNGGVGIATTSVFVQAAPPFSVTVTFTKTIVDSSNVLVSFTATVTGQGNAVVNFYDWNFGDGGTLRTTTNQVTHNYARPSSPPTLVATVTVSLSDGRTVSGTSQPITP